MRLPFLLPLLACLAAPLAAEPAQPVQDDERVMSCTALTTEIDALAAPSPVSLRKRGLGGFAKAVGAAMPVLGTAVPMLGLVAGPGGAVLMQAAGVAGAVGGLPSGHDKEEEAARLRDERRQRLLALAGTKNC